MADLGAPGVRIEEISSGPRPVSFSSTTDTGFVGLVTIPEDFFLGKLRAPGQTVDAWRPLLPLPRPSLTDAAASWEAALAFLPFARPIERKEAPPTQANAYRVNGLPRERREVEGLLRAGNSAKLYAVKDGARDEKDVVEGARAIRDRLSVPGEYQLEAKPGEITSITVTAVTRDEVDTAVKLADVVKESLGDEWEVTARGGADFVEVDIRDRSDVNRTGGRALRVNLRRSQVALRRDTDSGKDEWILSPRSDAAQALELRSQVLQSLAREAVVRGVPFKGDITRMVDDAVGETSIPIRELQEMMMVPARAATSIDSFESWQREFAEELFICLHQVLTQSRRKQAETLWRQTPAVHQGAWSGWVRTLPGMLRMELAARGFFTNGGRVAHLGVAIQGDRTGGPDKFQFLRASFDSLGIIALICAPGLDKGWQEALLNYAGPNGRGDLFAVLDTPRYLLTRAEDESFLSRDRWMKNGSGYEQAVLEVREEVDALELRFSGFANDELLSLAVPRDDRGYGAAYGPWLVIDNPRSIGPQDRFVVCPPSGHIAGMIVATDLKGAGGGVHKAPANEPIGGVRGLVTTVSDTEQGILNARNINIIRPRPFAGIRCWGARTTASDPLWRYVNVRRLFLMVERSLRDAIQWAVFLPNSDMTRRDLRTTISGFLSRVYMMGALDGATAAQAFSVRCDRENNPDTDVRDGFLTVDIELRPVYPAEVIRLRFRQSPMTSGILEG